MNDCLLDKSTTHCQGYPLPSSERAREDTRMNTKLTFNEPYRLPKYVYYCAFVASLSSFSYGYNTGIISAAILFIPHTMSVDAVDTGYIVSMVLLGATISSCFCGYLADVFGRRPVLIWHNLLFIISSIYLSSSVTVTHLLIGRFICGLAVGVASVLPSLYISEMAPTHMRGKLGAYNQFVITIGVILSYLVGYTVVQYICHDCWRYMFSFGILISVLQLVSGQSREKSHDC